MVRLVAMYKRPADTAAFDQHYFGTHKQITEKIPGIVEYRCSKVIGGPAGKSPWYMMTELCFKDKDSFKTAMMSPEAVASGKDLQSFAKDICEVFFIDEVPAPVQR